MRTFFRHSMLLTTCSENKAEFGDGMMGRQCFAGWRDLTALHLHGPLSTKDNSPLKIYMERAHASREQPPLYI